MSDKTPDPQVAPTYDSNAGAPANLAVQRPSDDELDQRDREKSRPRRAAGPPLRDDGPDAASRDVPSHEPPPATDPMSDSTVTGPPLRGQDTRGAATQVGNAGRPVDHVGPKPSADELDRRDRLKAEPRRAAGPPLRDDGPEAASRDVPAYEPPPATDPAE
jgi:hypothetical protein